MELSPKALAACACVLLCLPAAAQVERSQKSVGLRAGYVTRNRSAIAGLGLTYALSSRVRLAPAVGYVFRHREQDGFLFNLDCQYVVPVAQRAALYPLAGAVFSSWNRHEPSDDTSQRTTRLGVDLGAGIEYHATPALRLSAEARFDWVRHYDTGVFTVGISYLF